MKAPAGPSVRVASLLLVFAACCFGSIALFAFVAKQDGTTVLALLTWRYILALLILLVIAGRAVFAPRNRARSVPLIVFAGGAQAAIAYLSLAALDYMTPATLGFLFYTYPAWVAIIAAVRRTEPLTPIRLGALALSLTGIVIMVGSPWAEPIPLPGLLLALGSAFLYAAYIPLVERIQQGVEPTAATVYICVGAGVLFLAASIFTGQLGNLMLPGVPSWLAAAGIAIFSTVLGFIAFLRALPVLGTVRTAIICTVEPFYTALAGALLLGQPLTPSNVVGGVLIASAVVLLQLGSGREARKV